MIVDVYIGTERLELFNSEQIELVQGIQDVRDISKTTTDYSKSFVVPATKINNKIFRHYYYVGINGSFDARMKATGRIELGKTLYKEGYFLLNQVVIKEGNPFSYSITFFGVLSGLSNIIGDVLLGDLDYFVDNNYPDGKISYIPSEVKRLLTENTGTYIYSMFSNKELIYSSGSTGTTNTDTQINVAYTAPPDTGMRWQEFYPSIKVWKILESIENRFGLRFTHIDSQNPNSPPFLLSEDFNNLFMLLLNPDIVQNSEGSKKNTLTERIDLQRIETTGGDEWFKLAEDLMIVNPDYRGSNKWDKYDADITVTPTLAYMDIEYTLNRYVSFNGGAFVKQPDITGSGVLQEHSDYSDRAEGNYQVYWEVTAPQNFTFKTRIQLHYRFRHGLNHPINDRWYYCNGDANGQIIGGGGDAFLNLIKVNTLLPTIKVIEFLKGLISAFNLTISFGYLDGDGRTVYYLETLNNYYANLSLTVDGYEFIKDFTKYADVRDYTISKTESTNEFLFKFEDPQTKLNIEFKNVNTLGYGDYLHYINGFDANGQPVKTEGKRTVISVPFEQVLYNRIPITTEEVNFGLPLQVGGLYDESFSPVSIKPHLHYNTVSTFNDFGFIGAGSKQLLPPTINMPHYSLALSTFDTSGLQKSVFLFDKNEGSTFDIQGVLKPTDPRPPYNHSLFTNYYETYIESISNERVRIVNMKMRLPMREILQLQMNFVIKVGNNHYRINKVTTNLSTGISQFELITIV